MLTLCLSSLPATLDQATISTHSNGAPVYDQAYLSELRASTHSARPPTNSDIDGVDTSMTVDETTSELLGFSGKPSISPRLGILC